MSASEKPKLMYIAIICVCTGCELVRVIVMPRSQLVMWSVQVLRLHSHFLSNIRRHLLLGEVCCDYFALYSIFMCFALCAVREVCAARNLWTAGNGDGVCGYVRCVSPACSARHPGICNGNVLIQ
jgi:hypothetical protein